LAKTIWIDFTNSPHVAFFAPLVKEWERSCRLILTCRDHANTMSLLRMEGLDAEEVGGHYGKSSLAKLVGLGIRSSALVRRLRSVKIDVAVSHSSFYSPVVARLLNCRCVYINDNEHAKGNRIAFPMSTVVMVPEFFPIEKGSGRESGLDSKFVRYPGVKEGVYLSRASAIRVSGGFDSPPRVVFFRPEPHLAQYYSGDSGEVDRVLRELSTRIQVVVLPRDDKQRGKYRQFASRTFVVAEEAVSLDEVIRTAALFVGAGGTMTRELAVCGVPTVSTYQSNLLGVDEYLVSIGAMRHEPVPTVESLIDHISGTRPESGSELLAKGRAAFEMIRDTVRREVDRC